MPRRFSDFRARLPILVSHETINLESANSREPIRPASKAAVRALADTLRLEVLRHNSPSSHYTIHNAFLGDFVSPGFMKEQATKVHLNKTIQGLHQPIENLIAKFPSLDEVAGWIIEAADRGDCIITYSLEQHALFANMQGISPKRGWGVIDTLL